MAGIKLTKTAVERVKPDPARVLKVADQAVKGFALLVYPSGRKAFAVRYWYKGTRKLHVFQDYTGTEESFRSARAAAQDLIGKATDPRNPVDVAAFAKARKEADAVSAKERTFSAWKEDYIQRVQGRKKTWKRDVQYLALAEELFGKKHLSEVTARDCDVFFERTREKRGNTSANRALASLKACLSNAWRLGYIEANPALRVKPLREPAPRTRTFDDEEWARLLEGVGGLEDPFQKAGMALLFSTGCRLSEALNLKWEDVELDRALIRLPSPKAGKPQAIEIPDYLVNFLRDLPRPGKYVVAGRYAMAGEDAEAKKDEDKPRQDLKRAWIKVCTRAEVKGNIHDVRRTVGSRIARKYGVEMARHILRHSTPSTTWKHYVMGDGGEMRRALEGVAQESGMGKVLRLDKLG